MTASIPQPNRQSRAMQVATGAAELSWEEKALGVTTPGGPTLTERMRGITKRGGRSPMEMVASAVEPPASAGMITLSVLEGLQEPAAPTAVPQLDRLVVKADEAEAVEHHYRAATEAIDEAREWLRRVCPSALTTADGASYAFSQSGPDYEAHVAVGCRRTLGFLADVLCPPSEAKPDRNGEMRMLGPDNYVNRILRYLDQAKADDGQYELVSKDMTFLAAMLDHLIDRCQKGVHDVVSARDTRRIMLLTWSVLSELAQVASR